YRVDLFDAMPAVGRKFLRAGVGGLNLTHSEDFDAFATRYSDAAMVRPWLNSFGPAHLREWVRGLGIETFTGSSGRVFPTQKKASPLLRAWLHRLQEHGVKIHTRHRWVAWQPQPDGHQLTFSVVTPEREDCTVAIAAQSVVLALGGGSWSRLGSDGQWLQMLARGDVEAAPFRPSNSGFDYPWSPYMRERFAGQPLKSVALSLEAGSPHWRQGEAMISRHGVQGGLIYHASRDILQRIERDGFAQIYWDLMPDRSIEDIRRILALPRGKQSQANFLRKRLAFSGARAALLHELAPLSGRDPETLARAIKCLPQRLHSARPLDEAISTGGGIVAAE
ncbi:MAG: TIGR03862 family flavoprotein, partial [Pseudohongiella sp.]